MPRRAAARAPRTTVGYRAVASSSHEPATSFVFAVKGSRYITHMLRLRNARTALANLFASGPLALGSKLGPVLCQFPPNFKFDAERLEAFLELLPKTTEAAAELGRHHDQRIEAPAHLRIDRDRPLRHAMEIRHDSLRDPAFIALLRKYASTM